MSAPRVNEAAVGRRCRICGHDYGIHNPECSGLHPTCGCTRFEGERPQRAALAAERTATLDVRTLAKALKIELNRPHRAGHYDELAAAIAIEYAAQDRSGEPSE